MERLLVTGGSGFLGSYILDQTERTDGVLTTYFDTPFSHPTADIVQVDLTDPPFDRLRDHDPDHVVHCAGLVDVDHCEREPDLARRLNVEMTEHVATLAAETGASLTYVSTDAVFDGTRAHWREDDDPNPINVYGRTKLEGERAARRVNDDTTVVRTNFFGWNPAGSSLAEWMLDTLAAGEELTGFDDVFFTPLYAGDLARYLLSVLERPTPPVVHLGGRERLSKYQFAHELADVFGYDDDAITPISVDDLDLDAPRGKDLSLDVSLAESVLDDRLPDARTGLERMRSEADR